MFAKNAMGLIVCGGGIVGVLSLAVMQMQSRDAWPSARPAEVGGEVRPASALNSLSAACSCEADDGVAEFFIGLVTSGTLGAVSTCWAGTCETYDTISVAWGPHTNIGQSATVAIYDDPNDDGDPSDVTSLDLLSQAVVATAAPGDAYTEYPITPITVTGVHFIVVTTDDADGGADLDYPFRLDQSTTVMSSWFLGGISDTNDPVQSAAVSALIDDFGFPGNWMVRASGPATSAQHWDKIVFRFEGIGVSDPSGAAYYPSDVLDIKVSGSPSEVENLRQRVVDYLASPDCGGGVWTRLNGNPIGQQHIIIIDVGYDIAQ